MLDFVSIHVTIQMCIRDRYMDSEGGDFMKTIKKWMAYFMAVLMLCSMSQVRVLAEDALPTADTPKITEFKIQGVKGTVDDQQQKINVAGLPCNTDLTSLTAEVTCDPADAIVRFDPLKPSADDGQKKMCIRDRACNDCDENL